MLADGTTLAYDYLVVATGVTHSYFGHDEWAPYAPGLKTLDDALDIRRRILVAFERAEIEADAAARAAWLNFVIVGGGPTGVELAGTLAEIARHTLANEFRSFDPAGARASCSSKRDRAYSPRIPSHCRGMRSTNCRISASRCGSARR